MSRFKWLALAALLVVCAFIIAASPPPDSGGDDNTLDNIAALNIGQSNSTTSPEVDTPTGAVDTASLATAGNTGQVNGPNPEGLLFTELTSNVALNTGPTANTGNDAALNTGPTPASPEVDTPTGGELDVTLNTGQSNVFDNSRRVGANTGQALPLTP